MSAALWMVHCDGGCDPNPGPCGYGVVVVSPAGEVIERSGFIGKGTNNVAEITAAIRGLEQTPIGARVLLHSDSQYTLNGLKKWRFGWERRGWVTAKREPVANKELWLELYAVADRRSVDVRWVRGHSGDVYNERCDALAGEVIRSARRSGVAQRQAPPSAPAAPPPPAMQLGLTFEKFAETVGKEGGHP